MLYLGLYDDAGGKLDGPLLVSPEDTLPLLPRTLRTAVGSGASLLFEAAAQHGRKVQTALPELQPSAASLAEIALESGETVPTLRPLYLRPSDARPQPDAVARR